MTYIARVAALVIALTTAIVWIACSRGPGEAGAGAATRHTGGPSTTNTRPRSPAGSSQPRVDQPVATPVDPPIDVNATFGLPPMSAEEAAVAKRVQEILARDPAITSKRIYVGVSHSFNGRHTDEPQVTLAGSISSHNEWIAARNDLVKAGLNVLNALSVDPTHAAHAPYPPVQAAVWTEPADARTPSIPLCPGLTVVTTITSQGDYESIKTVESVDAKQVRIKYSSESSRPWWEVPPQRRACVPGTAGCANTQFVTHRTVLAGDLESARKYDQIFVTDRISPETNPGTTAIGTSASVLRELKTRGRSEISLCTFAEDTQIKDQDGQLHPVPAGCSYFRPVPLERVGNAPVPVRVLLNGEPVDVPAVQARRAAGSFTTASDEQDEFFFLDDERNPLTLKFRLGIGAVVALDPATAKLCDTKGKEGALVLSGDPPMSCDLPDGGDRDVLRVTKITTRCELPSTAGHAAEADDSGGGAAALEKALAETGTVDIYSIYFSFNSDKLRDESRPTLDDIAAVLQRHPDWRLQVNGHTDGVGGEQSNLDLSKRRAAAVKDALVSRCHVGADRLTTAGYGKSQPKDTNDTIEGRARNRRVELRRR